MFSAITKAYYRNALGALLVYDISSLESFRNVERWLNELKLNATRERDIEMMVVGNKKDLCDAQPELRQVCPFLSAIFLFIWRR